MGRWKANNDGSAYYDTNDSGPDQINQGQPPPTQAGGQTPQPTGGGSPYAPNTGSPSPGNDGIAGGKGPFSSPYANDWSPRGPDGSLLPIDLQPIPSQEGPWGYGSGWDDPNRSNYMPNNPIWPADPNHQSSPQYPWNTEMGRVLPRIPFQFPKLPGSTSGDFVKPSMTEDQKRWAKNPAYGYIPPSDKQQYWEGVPVGASNPTAPAAQPGFNINDLLARSTGMHLNNQASGGLASSLGLAGLGPDGAGLSPLIQQLLNRQMK